VSCRIGLFYRQPSTFNSSTLTKLIPSESATTRPNQFRWPNKFNYPTTLKAARYRESHRFLATSTLHSCFPSSNNYWRANWRRFEMTHCNRWNSCMRATRKSYFARKRKFLRLLPKNDKFNLCLHMWQRYNRLLWEIRSIEYRVKLRQQGKQWRAN